MSTRSGSGEPDDTGPIAWPLHRPWLMALYVVILLSLLTAVWVLSFSIILLILERYA